MKPVKIDSSVQQSCFKVCLPEWVRAENVKIVISRIGAAWSVTYPAVSLESGVLCFEWDYVLHNAPSGRYSGRIVVNGCIECDLRVDFNVLNTCAIQSL